MLRLCALSTRIFGPSMTGLWGRFDSAILGLNPDWRLAVGVSTSYSSCASTCSDFIIPKRTLPLCGLLVSLMSKRTKHWVLGGVDPGTEYLKSSVVPLRHQSITVSSPTRHLSGSACPALCGPMLSIGNKLLPGNISVGFKLVPPARGFHTTPRLGIRMLVIKRRQMKVHKRKKRRKRDRHLLMRRQMAKKKRAENEFHACMNAVIQEALEFDAETYVLEQIAKSNEKLAEEQKKTSIHWTEVMSMEQLFGLPDSNWIDVRAGLPVEEDLEEIEQKRIMYYEKMAELKSKAKL